jgi:molybdate transport system ATP-binding protein
VAQTGTVQEVFSRPANLAVAGLFTVETVQPGRIVKTADDLVTVAVGSALLTAVEGNLHLAATVRSVTREGPFLRVEVSCGFTLTVLLTRQAGEELALETGDRVVALVKAPQIHLIPRSA